MHALYFWRPLNYLGRIISHSTEILIQIHNSCVHNVSYCHLKYMLTAYCCYPRRTLTQNVDSENYTSDRVYSIKVCAPFQSGVGQRRLNSCYLNRQNYRTKITPTLEIPGSATVWLSTYWKPASLHVNGVGGTVSIDKQTVFEKPHESLTRIVFGYSLY